MVLHHIAQRARAFIITGAAFNPERLRRRDLNVVDIPRIPDRLEGRVSEAQYQNVLRRLLSKKMIDAVGLLFREGGAHDLVQLLR